MKGHKGHGKGHVKKGTRYKYLQEPGVAPKAVHSLVTATKQAQDLMRIVDALPDQETKDLAMELYKRLGEIE